MERSAMENLNNGGHLAEARQSRGVKTWIHARTSDKGFSKENVMRSELTGDRERPTEMVARLHEQVTKQQNAGVDTEGPGLTDSPHVGKGDTDNYYRFDVGGQGLHQRKVA